MKSSTGAVECIVRPVYSALACTLFCPLFCRFCGPSSKVFQVSAAPPLHPEKTPVQHGLVPAARHGDLVFPRRAHEQRLRARASSARNCRRKWARSATTCRARSASRCPWCRPWPTMSTCNTGKTPACPAAALPPSSATPPPSRERARRPRSTGPRPVRANISPRKACCAAWTRIRRPVGALAAALNRFVASLNVTIREVRDSTGAIASVSSQIASGNLDLAARTESQASSLEEIKSPALSHSPPA